jgi:ParB-like chromosome segregation protein Spo0J
MKQVNLGPVASVGAVTVRTIPVERIAVAPYNPRKDLKPGDPAWRKLKKSIDEFGLVEPLVWNEYNGVLIGGHQRLKILVAGGAVDVPVSVVRIEDGAKERALNVALNKQGGEWDAALLAGLADELDRAGLDMEIAGLDVAFAAEAPEMDEHGVEAGAKKPRAAMLIPARSWLMLRDEIEAEIGAACARYGIEVKWPKSAKR